MATGQRLQALHQMMRADCQWDATTLVIKYSKRLKTNDPIEKPLVLKFVRSENENLCVYAHLWAYMGHTLSQPAAPYVFSTVRTPTTRASPKTVSRQVRAALTWVDPQYSAYSARHASTSAAARALVHVNDILRSAGWASENTFSRFYNRPLHQPLLEEETNFLPHLLGL